MILELVVAWLLAHGEVASVICGATSPEEVRASAAAATWVLDDHELADIGRCLAIAGA